MLKTVWLTKEQAGDTAMLLGGFDGLHIGHRQLLACAKKSGLPVGAMTIVGGKGQSIFTAKEREDIFRRGGVDFLFELPFAEIKDMPSEAFLSLLQAECSPKLYVCGEDFRFGKGAAGTPQTLKERGQGCVEVFPLLTVGGEKVSSRTVKALLAQGKIQKANELLGERFFLLGRVEQDRQIGRTLGFPTANIAYPEGKLPLREGVYESYVEVDGIGYKGITHYGARPTFGDTSVVTETYLDGFEGDLYDRELKIEFVRSLRPTQKFDSVEGLRRQLETDIGRVRTHD